MTLKGRLALDLSTRSSSRQRGIKVANNSCETVSFGWNTSQGYDIASFMALYAVGYGTADLLRPL